MAPVNSYYYGARVTIEASFTDPDTGNPADPNHLVVTLGVSTGATPNPPTIVKDAVGQYHAEVDTASIGMVQATGVWTHQWVSDESAQAGTFNVLARPLG